MSSQISIVQRQMAKISELQEANTAFDLENKELHAKIAKLTEAVATAVAKQTEAPAKGTKRAVFAAGTVAVIATGALVVVVNNPEAAKKTVEKALACVAGKASSFARFVFEKGCDGFAVLRNLSNLKAVEIDLTGALVK